MSEVAAEFQFEERRTFDGVMWHVGTVYAGAIRRDDRFRELRRVDGFGTAESGRYRTELRERRLVDFRIARISVFNIFPDECTAGYHCGLILEGEGLAALEHARWRVQPFAYDLLVVPRE